MNKKQKFENFLESLKDGKQDTLIESVKQGFKACFEARLTPYEYELQDAGITASSEADYPSSDYTLEDEDDGYELGVGLLKVPQILNKVKEAWVNKGNNESEFDVDDVLSSTSLDVNNIETTYNAPTRGSLEEPPDPGGLELNNTPTLIWRVNYDIGDGVHFAFSDEQMTEICKKYPEVATAASKIEDVWFEKYQDEN